ncbi:protein ligase RNF216 [Seminavis robusta]|uniref:Protein ligase RNF216 n=1 Tax=Seminavis robusta TaxID=568900 RepID=A0A9N8H765_9STRA|nr:protein ligase RNF216 [Seminavis robusta]|eukprot:Sro168_g074770.1 protein ligase RNF216 (548) ;mRNA; f:36135-37972
MSSYHESKAYKSEAIEVLKHLFPLISVAAIGAVFLQNEHEFEPAYTALRGVQDIILNDRKASRRDGRHQSIVNQLSFLRGVHRIELKGKRISACGHPYPSSEKLLTELRRNSIEGFQTTKIETVAVGPVATKHPPTVSASHKTAASFAKKESDRNDDTLQPKQDGTVNTASSEQQWQNLDADDWTCQCCFCDYSFDEMVACSEATHFFCKQCVSGYAKEELYGNDRSGLTCMSSDGCQGTYQAEMLEKALSPKTMKNMAEHSYRTEVGKSEMEDDIWTCQKCGCLAVLDVDAKKASYVQCPGPGCYHKSCPLCKEDPHDGKTCQEFKAENERSNAHARIADAMSAAVMRSCPNCGTNIIKSAGCNKMKCSCGTKFCYVCRQVIVDYSHFCLTPLCNHTSCGKCVLFTDSVADDRRARRDAGRKEQEALGAAAADLSLLSPEKKPAATTGKGTAGRFGPPLQPQNNAAPNYEAYLAQFRARQAEARVQAEARRRIAIARAEIENQRRRAMDARAEAENQRRAHAGLWGGGNNSPFYGLFGRNNGFFPN